LKPDISRLRAQIEALPSDKRPEAEQALAELVEAYERDPLLAFRPHACPDCGLYVNAGCEKHRTPQYDFLAAATKLIAAFAGNRLGKTTGLVCKCLIQHCPEGFLPKLLRPFKVAKSEVVRGRFMCPSFSVLEGVILPEFRKWAPRSLLKGHSFDKAWDKQNRVLRFLDGGYVQFFTYEQDADKMVGASLDYVAYDEPPPEKIRNENLIRLIDRAGAEWFGMTPVNMTGGGIGWISRKIWKQRESPYVTCIKGSIHDNPMLSAEEVEYALSQYPEEERQAREFGDFLNFGGMVYGGAFERCLIDPPSPKQLEGHDIVVGIDPGMRNAAFVWVAFDRDNRAFVFDEVLLQDKVPEDYAAAIKRTNAKWSVVNPLYVIDPSARNRSLVNAESVEGELQRHGIFPMHGQNQVEAGVQNVRGRLAAGDLFVSRDCRGLRDEAEEYRNEDRPDGEFKVVKENDHRLDALRYACMSRAWSPAPPKDAKPLGWVPGFAPAWTGEERQLEPSGPMGPMS
jgi:phage terminase large subunit-like protein